MDIRVEAEKCAPWDHDFKLEPGSVISVQCNGRLWKQRITEVSMADEPIVPRPPMPPWWRPFARRKWRRAPVGPTMPVTRFRVGPTTPMSQSSIEDDDPIGRALKSMQVLQDALWPHGKA